MSNWILCCFSILFFIRDLMCLLLSSCRKLFLSLHKDLTRNSNLTFATQASTQLHPRLNPPKLPIPPVTECQLYVRNFPSSFENFYRLQWRHLLLQTSVFPYLLATWLCIKYHNITRDFMATLLFATFCQYRNVTGENTMLWKMHFSYL